MTEAGLKDIESKLAIARDLLRQHQFAQALLVSNQVRSAQAGNIEALWLAGSACLEMSDFQSAEGLIREYLVQDPGNEQAILRLSRCLVGLGRRPEAIKILQELSDHSDSGIVNTQLADMYLEAGNSDLAIVHARKVLQKDPQNQTALKVMSAALIMLGATAEAFKYLELVRRLTPADPQIYINLAALHEQNADNDLQLEALKTALLCDSRLHTLKLMLAETYFRMGRYKESGTEYKRYLAVDPDNFDALLGSAVAAKHAGDYDTAIATFLKAARCGEEQAELWCHLAECYKAGDASEQASKCCQRALILNPDMDWAQQILNSIK